MPEQNYKEPMMKCSGRHETRGFLKKLNVSTDVPFSGFRHIDNLGLAKPVLSGIYITISLGGFFKEEPLVRDPTLRGRKTKLTCFQIDSSVYVDKVSPS